MRRLWLLLLIVSTGCEMTDRGWRGNMTGDYRQVAACAADRLAAGRTLREDQRVAILAGGVRSPAALYEARLQETAPGRFFAEMRHGSAHPAGLAAWRTIQACAEGGPDRLHPPGAVRAAL